VISEECTASITLKMVMVIPSKILVTIYQTIWHDIPKDSNAHSRLTGASEKETLYNSVFVSHILPLGTLANNKDYLSYLHQNFHHSFPSIKLSNMNTFEIEKIILSLKPRNSHGYDEISSRILKISAPFVLSPLTYVFNMTIQTGTFLNRLKFPEIKLLI
jgi:hypothetical protein